MTKFITTNIIVLFISFAAYSQVDQEYSRTLQKMFEVSGTTDSYQVAITQMINMFKQQNTAVPQEFWDEMETEFANTSINDLTEMLVPVYAKYMTIDDLNELIKFYQSPIGKKFAKSTPSIMQESMQVGQQWGMKIGEEVKKKMDAQGY